MSPTPANQRPASVRERQKNAQKKEREASPAHAAHLVDQARLQAGAAAVEAIARLPLEHSGPMLRAAAASGLPLDALPFVAVCAGRFDLLRLADELGVSPCQAPLARLSSLARPPSAPLMAAVLDGKVDCALFMMERGGDPFAEARLPGSRARDAGEEPALGVSPIEAAALRGSFDGLAPVFERAARGRDLPAQTLNRVAASLSAAFAEALALPFPSGGPQRAGHGYKSVAGNHSRERAFFDRLAAARDFSARWLSGADAAAGGAIAVTARDDQHWAHAWCEAEAKGLPEPAVLPVFRSSMRTLPRLSLPAAFHPLSALLLNPESPWGLAAKPLLSGADFGSLDRSAGDEGVGALASLGLGWSEARFAEAPALAREAIARGARVAPPPGACAWLCPWLAAAARAVAAPDKDRRADMLAFADFLLTAAEAEGAPIPPARRFLAARAALGEALHEIRSVRSNSISDLDAKASRVARLSHPLLVALSSVLPPSAGKARLDLLLGEQASGAALARKLGEPHIFDLPRWRAQAEAAVLALEADIAVCKAEPARQEPPAERRALRV
jgi:hypothetical protein